MSHNGGGSAESLAPFLDSEKAALSKDNSEHQNWDSLGFTLFSQPARILGLLNGALEPAL